MTDVKDINNLKQELKNRNQTSAHQNQSDNQNLLNQLIDETVKLAKNVTKLRANNVKQVELYKSKIENLQQQIEGIVKEIDDALQQSPEGKEGIEEVKQGGKDVVDALQQLVNRLSFLCKRFQNEKIKVAAIGDSGSGKTTFLRKWTGLGEDVLYTHDKMEEDGLAENIDCTGSVCNFHQYIGDDLKVGEFRGFVCLRTRDEVLKIINEAYQDIIDSAKGIGHGSNTEFDRTCGGRIKNDTFNDLNKIKELIDKEDNEFYRYLTADSSNPWGINVEESKRVVFSRFFKSSVYIDELSNNNKTYIEVNDSETLKKYNFIQHDTPCYMIVKKIDLYIKPDPGVKNILESFEISDTKGISDLVNAEKDLMNAIEESDAVFSVFMSGKSKTGIALYDSILRKHFCIGGNWAGFPQKHFVIYNQLIGLSEQAVKNDITMIKNTQCSNLIYRGKLKTNPDSDEPREFTLYVLCHMLNMIAENIHKIDSDRLRECNEDLVTIKKQVEAYLTMLQGMSLKTSFNEAEHIKKRIQDIQKEILSYTSEKMNETGYDPSNSVTEADANAYIEECKKAIKHPVDDAEYVRYISPYEVITGIKPSDESEVDNDEKAVGVLCDSIMCSLNAEKESMSDYNIGTYLNRFVVKLRNELHNRTRPQSTQRKINIREEQDALFDKVFSCTKISKTETLSNDYAKEIIELYHRDFSEPLCVIPELFSVFDLLKTYFENADDYGDGGPQRHDNNVIQYEKLKDAVKEKVEDLELANHLATKHLSRPRFLYEMYKEIKELFENIGENNSCYQYYIDKFDILYADDNDVKKEKDRAINDNRIMEKRNALMLLKSRIDEIEDFEIKKEKA